MADIKDILGLSRDPAREAMAAPRVKKVQMKKPEGMSREVFALLQQDAEAGRTTVPIAPTGRTDSLLKEKRTRMVGWEWQGFNNSGRTDGLRLSHWRKNNDKSTDYTFSRFNKTVRRSTISPWIPSPPAHTSTSHLHQHTTTHRCPPTHTPPLHTPACQRQPARPPARPPARLPPAHAPACAAAFAKAHTPHAHTPRAAVETEQVGTDILTDLDTQRQTIHGARNRRAYPASPRLAPPRPASPASPPTPQPSALSPRHAPSLPHA